MASQSVVKMQHFQSANDNADKGNEWKLRMDGIFPSIYYVQMFPCENTCFAKQINTMEKKQKKPTIPKKMEDFVSILDFRCCFSVTNKLKINKNNKKMKENKLMEHRATT